MKLSKAAWEELRLRIDILIAQDENITDVSINYELKESKEKHFLRINLG